MKNDSSKVAKKRIKPNLKKWVNLLNEYQTMDMELFPKTLYASLGDKDRKKPQILMFTADWHLGSKSCNYKQWFEDIQFLLSLPPEDVRLVLVGDLIDNVPTKFKSAEAVFGYLRPELQRELLKEVLEYIRPYLEVATWGNHDIEWDEKNTGFSDVAQLLGDKCTYFYGKGTFDYNVGNECYKFHISHKLKGRSNFHALQGNINAWLYTHADVVVTAHGHEPAYMMDCRGMSKDGVSQERHLLQIGSYKGFGDTYSDRNFKPGIVHNDVLVLYPDEHKIMHFSTLYDASKWLGLSKKTNVLF